MIRRTKQRVRRLGDTRTREHTTHRVLKFGAELFYRALKTYELGAYQEVNGELNGFRHQPCA